MSDEYNFTTESIRANLHHLWNLPGAPGKRAAIDAEFDRWLAARDREVAATTLRDAATALRSHGVEHEPQANWLRERADRTEKGAGDVR